jgi:hypothetical protein
LFSNPLNLCSSLKWETVSHPCKTRVTGHNIHITSLLVHFVLWMPDIILSHVRPVTIQASRKYKFPTPKFWLCCRMPSLSLFRMLNHSFEYSHLNSLPSSCNREKLNGNLVIITLTFCQWVSSKEANHMGKISRTYLALQERWKHSFLILSVHISVYLQLV